MDATGLRLAVLAGDANAYRVRLWTMTHPAVEFATLPAWGPGVLDLHPQGEWILTSGPVGSLRQRKWSVGGKSAGRPDISPRSRFTGAAWSPDGDRIVTVDSAGVVRVWEAEIGHLVGSRIEVPGALIEGVELSADGRWVRIEEVGGVVQVYDVVSGRPSTEPWWPPVRRTGRVRGERQSFGLGGGVVWVPEGETGVRTAPHPPPEGWNDFGVGGGIPTQSGGKNCAGGFFCATADEYGLDTSFSGGSGRMAWARGSVDRANPDRITWEIC